MVSSAMLQILAMICMLIDHVGAYLVDNFWLMRVIGRIAMPLFVFGLTEGFIHTKSRKNYFLRILGAALVTEVVLYFLQQVTGSSGWHNILFNFLLAFIALLCAEKSGLLRYMIPLLALLATCCKLDYGWAVVALAVCFYAILKHCQKGSMRYVMLLLISLLAVNLLLAAINNTPLQIYAVLATIPLAFYRGKKGRRLPKYIGYAFYPAHLLLILIIRLLLD